MADFAVVLRRFLVVQDFLQDFDCVRVFAFVSCTVFFLSCFVCFCSLMMLVDSLFRCFFSCTIRFVGYLIAL